MQKTLLAGLFTVIAVAAQAGGMAEPVMEPTIIVETMEAASGSAPYLPIIIMALLVAVASS